MRQVALVASAVFDAVNGIERRCQSIHVKASAPRDLSQRAAAIQAAYAILINLYPAQIAALTQRRDASIAAISSGAESERVRSIEGGIAWGQFVADSIWAWRAADGFNPNPAPTFLKTFGAYAGPRTADQSELALFWAANTPLFWIRIASQISARQHLTLSENAHLFALLNVSMADAGIACWDAKYRFVLWRPITAVREGSIDRDTTWKPWLDFFAGGTPAHPESPSGHSTVSGAAAFILTSVFGDHTPFDIDSDIRPGVRAFSSFSSALAEIHDARVFGGIHWRAACRLGSAVGQAVAAYVSTHAMQLRDRDDDGDQR